MFPKQTQRKHVRSTRDHIPHSHPSPTPLSGNISVCAVLCVAALALLPPPLNRPFGGTRLCPAPTATYHISHTCTNIFTQQLQRSTHTHSPTNQPAIHASEQAVVPSYFMRPTFARAPNACSCANAPPPQGPAWAHRRARFFGFWYARHAINRIAPAGRLCHFTAFECACWAR